MRRPTVTVICRGCQAQAACCPAASGAAQRVWALLVRHSGVHSSALRTVSSPPPLSSRSQSRDLRCHRAGAAASPHGHLFLKGPFRRARCSTSFEGSAVLARLHLPKSLVFMLNFLHLHGLGKQSFDGKPGPTTHVPSTLSFWPQ